MKGLFETLVRYKAVWEDHSVSLITVIVATMGNLARTFKRFLPCMSLQIASEEWSGGEGE
jgi:hypothetical protein